MAQGYLFLYVVPGIVEVFEYPRKLFETFVRIAVLSQKQSSDSLLARRPNYCRLRNRPLYIENFALLVRLIFRWSGIGIRAERKNHLKIVAPLIIEFRNIKDDAVRIGVRNCRL